MNSKRQCVNVEMEVAHCDILLKFTSTGLVAYSIIEKRPLKALAGEFVPRVNEDETCGMASPAGGISISTSTVLLFKVAPEPMTSESYITGGSEMSYIS